MGFDLQSVKDRSDAGFTCLSIGQMAFVRQVLDAAGVLDHEVEMPEIKADWNEARSPHPRRIPAFKLQSNDWWFVEPEECHVLADALENDGAHKLGWVAATERANAELEPWTAVFQRAYPGSVALAPTIERDQCAAVLADFAAFCRKCEHEDGFIVS